MARNDKICLFTWNVPNVWVSQQRKHSWITWKLLSYPTPPSRQSALDSTLTTTALCTEVSPFEILQQIVYLLNYTWSFHLCFLGGWLRSFWKTSKYPVRFSLFHSRFIVTNRRLRGGSSNHFAETKKIKSCDGDRIPPYAISPSKCVQSVVLTDESPSARPKEKTKMWRRRAIRFQQTPFDGLWSWRWIWWSHWIEWALFLQ